MKHVLLFTFLSLFLTNCFEAPESIAEEEIYGTWVGLSYKQGETYTTDEDAASIGFNFSDDNTYKGIYGEQIEDGIYRIDGNKLYTTAKGFAEKNVKLEYVSQDSMIMEMNRSGVIEIITLGKAVE